MARKRKRGTTTDHSQTRQPIYRYWVTLHEIEGATTRELPLKIMQRIQLKAAKKGEPLQPAEQFLELIDGELTLEARDLDDLASQLRQKYPDEHYERRLHSERDLEAEARYYGALDSLIKLLAEAVVEDLLKETDC